MLRGRRHRAAFVVPAAVSVSVSVSVPVSVFVATAISVPSPSSSSHPPSVLLFLSLSHLRLRPHLSIRVRPPHLRSFPEHSLVPVRILSPLRVAPFIQSCSLSPTSHVATPSSARRSRRSSGPSRPRLLPPSSSSFPPPPLLFVPRPAFVVSVSTPCTQRVCSAVRTPLPPSSRPIRPLWPRLGQARSFPSLSVDLSCPRRLVVTLGICVYVPRSSLPI